MTQPTPTSTPHPIQQYWQLLARYLRPQRGRVAVMTVALLGGITLQLIHPQVLARFIDVAVADATADALLNLALMYIGVALGEQVLRVVSVYAASSVGWTATNALRADLAAHCMSLDLAFHKTRTPGELIERVDGDVTTLSRFFSQFIIIILGNGLLLVGVVIALFFVHPLAGVGGLVFTVAALLLMLRLRNIAVPYFRDYRQQAADFYGFAGEQLTGREDINANGAHGFFLRRLFEINQAWMLVYHKARLASTTLWASTDATFALGSVLALTIGALLFQGDLISIGMVFLIFNYFSQLARPITQIREEIELFQQADASIQRIRELLDTESRLDAGGETRIPDGAFALVFDKVSFHYDDPDSDEERDWALRDIDFELPAGETLGLLGRTGSGKSTTARLLLRLYDPQRGEIRLNNVPLRESPLTDLRQRVGLVTQDVQIFEASVRDNITFFDDRIPDRQVIEAFALLGLTSWFETLPNGLDTPLGSDGRGLSAGEAQLVAFARVFLKQPGLIILDEASSRLDPLTERLIEQAVDRLLEGRTGIIIAHRLATVQRTDRIMVLENGHVVEYGKRAELAQTPDSRFSALLRAGQMDLLA